MLEPLGIESVRVDPSRPRRLACLRVARAPGIRRTGQRRYAAYGTNLARG